MASVQRIVMLAVKTSVATALTGRGYTSDNIRIRRRPSVERVDGAKRCIIAQMPETVRDQATNERDECGYGVLVTLAQAGEANPEYNDDFDELITDRETLRHYFHNRPDNISAILPGGYVLVGLKVEPGPMLIDVFHANGIDATALVLRVLMREPRT